MHTGYQFIDRDFSQENENEEEDSLEISEQENVFQENYFPKNAVSAGVVYLGVSGKYAVKGPCGFIISPSLNLDVLGYTTIRVQVLFGNSW